MGGGATVKKKIKRVTDLLASKRLQPQTNIKPSTPSKKDSRPWEWRTPRRSGTLPSSTSTASRPLPALLSFLSSTLSPHSKSRPQPTPSDPAAPIVSRPSTPSVSDQCACDHYADDSASLFNPPMPAAVDDGSDTSDLEDEEEPDIQDGIDGNYHATAHSPSANASTASVTLIVFIPSITAPHTTQLMRGGLWPATWEKPRSAITLQALKTFHSLTLNAHLNAHDFVSHLERLSDNVAPDEVKDRVREFRIAVRTYSFVRACRRAGEPPSANLKTGSLAVLCPACPQPGQNMRPGWEQREEQFAYMDALHFCIDGNFHFNLKPKHTDPNDYPLTKGAAYFANEDDFKHYIATTKPYPNEPSTCSQFVAMGAGKYKGLVSGIIALVCRHNFVMQGGIVDLTKGEKFLYVDFALVSAMQRYRNLHMLLASYDINCQYIKKLARRLQDQFSLEKTKSFKSIQSGTLPKRVVAGIGKYHAPMHTADCRPFHSLNNLPGAGDTFGENAEQKWADIEGISRATKEMAAGHRHDKVNDQNSDANTKLVHSMVEHLLDKHEVAVQRLTDARAYLGSVETSIADPSLVAKWRNEHDVWERDVVDVTNHARMNNPFEISTGATLTTKMIATQLSEEHEKAGDRHGVSMVDAMEVALRLDETRLDLLRKISSSDGTDKSRKALALKLEHYRRDLRLCREEFEILLAPAVAKAVQDAQSGNPTLPTTFPRRSPNDDLREGITTYTGKAPTGEASQDALKRKSQSRAQKALRAMAAELEESALLLPSAYHLSVRNHVGMKMAVQTEWKLREGVANEALNKLRLHLTTYQALELRRRQVSGVIQNTEVDRRLCKKRLATDRAKHDYRKNRYLLRVLGMPEEHATFKVLEDRHCYAFAITAAEHRLGDSHRLPSWIWGDFSYVAEVQGGDIRKFLDDSLKAHWFRHSALVRRWEEAVHTRREEMFRTLTSYRADREKWIRRAQARAAAGALGAAAYARRQAYRYQRLQTKAETKFPSIIYQASSKTHELVHRRTKQASRELDLH
ncbi:hypothetical protein GSI_09726 [Ganoderma sinense ZZ0214-1]|uniref:CxC2-like cysteine cluster KDZ transposase-associated domain-containing protein n=1 Tax=Ganoderma sinense ZZ0214-1 TaxID=1077348 RepID=A0A2G8S339_9APHY|nr:hypothetical protein GSI_09726 [Ganoderma sinense ZZ0214-1]